MKRIIQNNLFMLRYMWKYAKGNMIARFFTVLLAPVQPFVFIICMKLALDGIADGKPLSYILTIIAGAFLASTVAALITFADGRTAAGEAARVFVWEEDR